MSTILLDADIVAYKVATVNEDLIDWGDTGTSLVLDHTQAIKQTDELVASYCEALDASRAIICLSDPDVNFRKQLEPTYKSNRKDVKKPELLLWLKDYLAAEYQSYIRPRLEADDVMGILATSGDRFIKGEKIMVSEDKDMRTVPGLSYNPDRPELGVLDITEEEANRFHMWQTIVGDPTDGYTGCPGIGMGDKEMYEEETWGFGARTFGFPHEIFECDPADLWDVVVEAYASKGLTEEDAILQARLAHILWASSYNFKKKKVKLWQPYWLS